MTIEFTRSGHRYLLCLLSLGLVACSAAGAPARPSLSLFAASSLTQAIEDVARSFEQQYGVRVAASYGASSQLRLQVEQGARADVFASADEVQTERLQSAGLLAGEPAVFARNRLVVLVSPRQNPAISSLLDLAQPGVRLAAADPSVPIGAYALQSLDAMSRAPAFGADFRERVERNVVTREANVRQIVAKVELGEVDAAMVYGTDAVAAPGLQTIDIPDALNVEARYSVAVLRDAHRPDLARAFVDHLLSHAGQRTLMRWGFRPVGEGLVPSRPATAHRAARRGTSPRPTGTLNGGDAPWHPGLSTY